METTCQPWLTTLGSCIEFAEICIDRITKGDSERMFNREQQNYLSKSTNNNDQLFLALMSVSAVTPKPRRPAARMTEGQAFGGMCRRARHF